jgi:hypothetical protein
LSILCVSALVPTPRQRDVRPDNRIGALLEEEGVMNETCRNNLNRSVSASGRSRSI